VGTFVLRLTLAGPPKRWAPGTGNPGFPAGAPAALPIDFGIGGSARGWEKGRPENTGLLMGANRTAARRPATQKGVNRGHRELIRKKNAAADAARGHSETKIPH